MTEPRKNVLFIFVEDMGVHAGPWGNTTVPTPAIDALARLGCVFENACCASPTCSPSRSAVYTGLFPHQNGHVGLAGAYGYGLHDGVPLVTDLLQHAGYFSSLNYKIHVRPEERFKFDRDFTGRDYAAAGSHPKDAHLSAKFLREVFAQVPAGHPFFSIAQTHDTHRPFDPPHAEKLMPVEVAGLPYRRMTAADVRPLPEMGEVIDDTNRHTPEARALLEDIAGYYNSVQRVDQSVGLFMKALEDSGKTDDTVVIFAADHGPPWARGKLNLTELGSHVPLIIHWPGVTKPGSRVAAPVSLADLFPTILDAAGVAAPAYLSTTSLKPLLKDPTGAGALLARDVFAEHHTHTTVKNVWPMRMVRHGRFKLIHNLAAGRYPHSRVFADAAEHEAIAAATLPADSPVRLAYERWADRPEYELFDLTADPAELTNLVDDPAFSESFAELKQKLHDWRTRTADPFLDPAYYEAWMRRFEEKVREIHAWIAAHPQEDVWQSNAIESDQSMWKRNWSQLEPELIAARSLLPS